MHEASFYEKLNNGKVRCTLCPHDCIISEGKSGICRIRIVNKGKLISDTYQRLSAVSADPIEKKPLYHFFPGKPILSIGSIGCNMRCRHCQNEDISQCLDITSGRLRNYTKEDIFNELKGGDYQMLAFTYNEPLVNYEFYYDTAVYLEQHGIERVVVSNGYISNEPLRNLIPYVDAFNIDLKAFNDDFYRKVTSSSLQPVLNAIETILKNGRHLEITYLVIPGLNDNENEFREMIRYLKGIAGADQVLHLSRYFPHYKMARPPTSVESINRLLGIAKEKLNYVYPGNMGAGSDANTCCPNCGNLLIERQAYITRIVGMEGNHCAECKTKIHGKFKPK